MAAVDEVNDKLQLSESKKKVISLIHENINCSEMFVVYGCFQRLVR